MCGFFITNDPTVDDQKLDLIESSLRFRGPDGSSELITRGVWKAYHARLSIIDINSGVNQPVVDKDGGLLVFNGEILNYKHLGFKYFSKEFFSDTLLLSELLMHGHLNLKELDGFFAFVYINSKGSLSIAARDRFGVKPLYLYKKDAYISFSSEPNTFRKLFETTVNDEAIEEYYAARAPIFSGSYFNEVDQIPPGSCFVSGEYFNCNSFLNGDYSKISKGTLQRKICDGINTRKISDAPVGLLLSRGIDSNLLKELGVFKKYYSIGFKEDEDIKYLESKKIENLTTIECSASEYKKNFDYLLQLRGEPMSVPNEVLLYTIANRASEDGIKVLLSGEGADEFFGGYDRIFGWAANANSFDLDIFLKMYCYKVPNKNSLVYQKFRQIFANQDFYSVFEAVRWFFIRFHMPVLFRRLDFSLMAAGVEGREPLANMHVFEIAAKMSVDDLIGNKRGKLPLRELISDFLGQEFAYEQKIGFPVDLTSIFENPNNLDSYDLWFEENLKVLA